MLENIEYLYNIYWINIKHIQKIITAYLKSKPALAGIYNTSNLSTNYKPVHTDWYTDKRVSQRTLQIIKSVVHNVLKRIFC